MIDGHPWNGMAFFDCINTNMETINKIQELLKIINPSLFGRYNTDLGLVDFTFTHLIERLKSNLDSIELLHKDGIKKHRHVLGLSCRNILSDYIIGIYLDKMSINSIETEKKVIGMLISDFDKVNRYLKLIEKLEPKKAADAKSNIEQYQFYSDLKKNAKKFGSITLLPTGAIVDKAIKEKPLDEWTKQLVDSYDIWVFFSKYEHIGWYSYNLTRIDPLKEIDTRIAFVLICAANMLTICFDVLKDEKAKLETINLLDRLRS